ncbi:MAG TPA: hypothetical protein VLA03_08975 [Draconibacterium sp.]|nr:hypothetical protein [Draconibacterium sp.]
MKKLSILFIILILVLPAFAGLKSKHVAGDWKYTITLSNIQMERTFTFFQKNSKLEGKATDSEGSILSLSKIKMDKKNNTLFFEIPRESDVSIEFMITLNDNKFKGKGWIDDTSFKITGEKLISTN